MSIEAIKEALKAVQPCGRWHRSGAAVNVDESEEWARVRIEVKANKLINRKLSAFIAACNPPAIRSLIERLEAAEKDAKRYAFLRNSVLVDGEIDDTIYVAVNSPDWKNKWALVGKDLDAAIDSAMAGGLAEGVSDGK